MPIQVWFWRSSMKQSSSRFVRIGVLPGSDWVKGVELGMTHVEIDARRIQVTRRNDLFDLARQHLGDGPPGLQLVHLVHAAAKGALNLVEHGE